MSAPTTARPTPVATAGALDAPPARTRFLLVVGAAVVAATLALVLAAGLGGAARAPLLADPGVVTRWGLLGARVLLDVSAMLTVGALVVAVLSLPRGAAALDDDAARLVRLAARWSVAWAVAALVAALLTLSDVAGRGVAEVLSPGVLPLAVELPQTRALLSSAWLAVLVGVFSRRTSTTAGAGLVLLSAGCALLPPLLTAHAAHEAGRLLAIGGLVVHVAAASVWLGGLAALALHLRARPKVLARALPRWSRAALGCFVLVGLSGALTATLLLDRPGQLLATPYGRVLLLKVAVLVALGVLGHLHRRRTVAAVASGRTRAFLVLAAVELVVMAAAAGLAVGLARTAPPADGGHGERPPVAVVTSASAADGPPAAPDD